MSNSNPSVTDIFLNSLSFSNSPKKKRRTSSSPRKKVSNLAVKISKTSIVKPSQLDSLKRVKQIVSLAKPIIKKAKIDLMNQTKSKNQSKSNPLKNEHQKNSRENDDNVKKVEKEGKNEINSNTFHLNKIESKISSLGEEFEEYREKTKKILIDVLRDCARAERKFERISVARNDVEIGSIRAERNGHMVDEKFVYGENKNYIKDKKKILNERLKNYSSIRKKLNNLRKKSSGNNKTHDKNGDTDSLPTTIPFVPEKLLSDSFDGYAQTEEILKAAATRTKKEILSLESSERALKEKAQEHMLCSRRLCHEASSRFADLPVLKDRYLFLRIAGRGGFSEVWKAFDLIEYRYVACKVHQLNSQWSDERKKSYIRHATREYEIHKSIAHPAVVPLHDVFGIDLNSFCTVLKFCDGEDLEKVLKKSKTLSEKEARIVILQIFQALKYLSEKTSVIHYDLKPGNILFHNGIVQITDFGLSKRIENNSKIVELTSQGAGTYWYLPPETFESGASKPPIISSKVDVWSAGVILYQMLFGVRPFGHEMSQETIMRKGVLRKSNLNELKFPVSPKVSEEAKDLVSKCLTVNTSLRPDAKKVLKHAFFDCFRMKKKFSQ